MVPSDATFAVRGGGGRCGCRRRNLKHRADRRCRDRSARAGGRHLRLSGGDTGTGNVSSRGPPQIKELPIAFDEKIYKALIKEVENIIESYERNDLLNIEECEKNINNYVYKLYNISDAEINVIEGIS